MQDQTASLPPSDDPFDLAVRAHEAGDLATAERLYRSLLSQDPEDWEVRYLLGLAMLDAGRAGEAAESMRALLEMQPKHAAAWLALGRGLLQLGDPALESLRRAIEIDPSLQDQAEPLLATAMLRAGETRSAIEMLIKARREGREVDRFLVDAAVAQAEQAGLRDDATRLLVCEAESAPDDLDLLVRAGFGLAVSGRAGEAVGMFRRAVAIKPGDPRLLSNLGAALSDAGDPEQALQCFETAIELEETAEVVFNRGRVLEELWRPDESIAAYRRALELAPTHRGALSNLLLDLNYRDDVAGERLREEHVRIAVGLRDPGPQPQSATPRRFGRPLRVGFVSGDLREHAVACFLEPLVEHLDRNRVLPIAISTRSGSDHVTDRLRTRFGDWIRIHDLSDADAASAIRQARIDVLIDLAGHTDGNRLAVFTHRPAQVQATWLGYPNTTGLREIDWRIVDEVTDPPGTDALMVERPLRLSAPFLCYRPPAPPPRRAPRAAGPIRFGSFNKLAKVSARCIALWSRVLQTVPDSTLSIKAALLRYPGVRQRVEAAFSRHGIDGSRVRAMPPTAGAREHLAMYGRIDIALDTFPYHGTTTTCEALWSGVPVVSLVGDEHRSRVGATILNSAGLAELATRDESAFVEAARRLSVDVERLADLQANLGVRMTASRLCDGRDFAARFEDALFSIASA